MEHCILHNGVSIPSIGFGTWQIPDGPQCVDAVKKAIDLGYRHFDTAFVYENEESVGKAIRESGIPREEFFVTSKLRNPDQKCEFALHAFELTMNLLGLDYLDMYLIHWPIPKGHNHDYADLNLSAWRAFEWLYKHGYIRAIGVCNFEQEHLQTLLDRAEIRPMVNQIEYHPGYARDDLVLYCQSENVLVEAWSPLGNGKILSHPPLQEIAGHYHKSVGQLCLRWIYEKGIVPLPKSVHVDRMQENLDIFDFELSEEDRQRIGSLPTCGWSGLDAGNLPFYV